MSISTLIIKADEKLYTIPSNFCGSELLNKFPSDNKFIKADKLNYLVSLIYNQTIVDSNSYFFGYALLSTEILREKIKHYKVHFDYLIKHNIIDTKNYLVGKHCKRYKLKSKYLVDVKSISIPNKTFVKKNTKPKVNMVQNKPTKATLKYKHQLPTDISNNCKYDHLNSWFNTNLSIDYVECKQLAEKLAYKKNDKYSSMRYNQYLAPINEIVHNSPSLLLDGFGKRYYSPITKLKSDFRNFIRYNNKPLAAIDVRNSLPYILGLLVYHVKHNKKSEIIDICNRIIYRYYINRENFIDEKLFLLPHMLHDFSNMVESEELDRYMKLICDKDIYIEFANRLIEKDKDYLVNELLYSDKLKCTLKARQIYKKYNYIAQRDDYNREVSKGLFVRILSAQKNSKKYFKVFDTMFPTISIFLDNLKTLGDATNSHKCSSQILQNLESHLILNVICKEFVLENKSPVYTIHDNIASLKSHKDFLQTKANEVFARYCPYKASFHDEDWINTKMKINRNTNQF